MRVGAWELCLGQEWSWGLCLASAVSSLLTFLANCGSSGAGGEGEEAAPRPCSLWPPLYLQPLGNFGHTSFPPDLLGQERGRPCPGPGVTLFTWQVQDPISGYGLNRQPFPLPAVLKTVIKCHFPWQPSLSSGAVGIITRPGPSLPRTAPRTDATCVLSTLGAYSHPALKPPTNECFRLSPVHINSHKFL